jgi:uncharacterized membrane protein
LSRCSSCSAADTTTGRPVRGGVLAERYAKGEISAEEYRQRLSVLQRKDG